MHAQHPLILALTFAAAALTSALPPTLHPRQNGVTCQTSDGSPTTEDVTAVINELGGQGGKCPQTNDVASECTTLVTEGSAAIAICGGTDPEDGGMDCTTVAGYANQIQQACLSVGRAGGTYTIGPSQRVEVIHSE
ncbi:MAG: hypothetical protein L6R38_006209 [Xanthoria sp. 2 TBL-2021]|nr:MAG: hypothetical protein L6R38_006209 [Xanthoria sp. 2 TBL-2021]